MSKSNDRSCSGHPRPSGRGIPLRARACRRAPGTRSPPCRSAPDDDLEGRRKDIIDGRQRRSMTADGVIILTDMFGGTPSNLAISLMRRRQGRGACRAQSADAGQARPRPRRSPLGKAVVSRPRRRAANTSTSPARSWATDLTDGRSQPVTRDMDILNSRGLHARASAKFVKCAEQFDAAIDGQPRRPDRARHLDHGTDDAGAPSAARPSMSRPRARKPRRRSTRWPR